MPKLNLKPLLIFCLSLNACTLFHSPTPSTSYTVRRGDTLYQIAQEHGISLDEILDLNDDNLDNPNKLQIGQKIRLPKNIKANSKKVAATNKIFEKDDVNQSTLKTIRINEARVYIGKLLWPVTGAKVESGFGRRWFKFHDGLDLPAKEGTPIYAAHSGKVVYSDDGVNGYGNVVVIKGDYGLLTVYGHNYRNLVEKGDYVEQGQQIAQVGSTGHATGAHCHFETRVKDSNGQNVAIDPLVFFAK